VNKVGILHPGEMGFAVANSVLNSGHEVYWCSEGRSEATRQRAQTLNLSACSTLDELCRTCGILISVCPPHAALDMAQAVKDSGFRGLYADINAIAPNTMKTLADNLQTTGITVIDGGIIGLPPVSAGTTWLHLSGHGAEQVADCFSAGPMETSILGPEIGQASGLKMCFAANSKGTAALHAAILGAADNLGVREALERQWDTYTPGFTAKAHGRIRQVARKAWRFTGEMEEIAATLSDTGMPPEFFLGAARIYARQTGFKDIAEEPTLEEILQQLSEKSEA